MLKNFLAGIWRVVPAGVRRWTIRLTNAHFTVTAGAVIFNEEGQVLILKHRFRAGSGWGLPGGFLKQGEQPLEALQRELREEIGIEVEGAEIFWARSFKRPKQIEILFSGFVKGEVHPQSMEVERFVWCLPDALPSSLSEDQKLLVKRAVEKRAV
jgi:8-oxo-dGTP diphosphatase